MYRTDPMIIESYDGHYVARQIWSDDVLIKNIRLSKTFKKRTDAERELRKINDQINRRK